MGATASLSPGAAGEATAVVVEQLTVRHFVPTMPAVYGTPFMIMLMEMAAANAMAPGLPEGWVSVGVDVNIRHLAATPLGRTVTASALVTRVGAKLVEFEVQAHDGVNLIGKGTHSRAPVELARFERAFSRGSP
jgi:fluoroacetyl-CoA thioesterase